MAFRPVETGQATDIKKHLGTAYVGVYKEARKIQTKIGEQTIYKFEYEDGEEFSIYGFTNLNRAMEHVALESLVRITYLGKENVQTKFGMKDVHQVKVEVDDDEPVTDIRADMEPI